MEKTMLVYDDRINTYLLGNKPVCLPSASNTKQEIQIGGDGCFTFVAHFDNEGWLRNITEETPLDRFKDQESRDNHKLGNRLSVVALASSHPFLKQFQ